MFGDTIGAYYSNDNKYRLLGLNPINKMKKLFTISVVLIKLTTLGQNVSVYQSPSLGNIRGTLIQIPTGCVKEEFEESID